MVKFYSEVECERRYNRIIAIFSIVFVATIINTSVRHMQSAQCVYILMPSIVSAVLMCSCSYSYYHKAINIKALYKLSIQNKIRFLKTLNEHHYYEVKNTRGKILVEIYDSRYYGKNMTFLYIKKLSRRYYAINKRFMFTSISGDYYSNFVLDHLEFLRGGPNESDN